MQQQLKFDHKFSLYIQRMYIRRIRMWKNCGILTTFEFKFKLCHTPNFVRAPLPDAATW